MKTIEIANGITLTATDATIAAYEAERKAIEDEMFFENQLREEEAVARATGDWSVYSDLFKDMYGIRPRWMWQAPAWA